MNDLYDDCEYLAEHLLGWERKDIQPGEKGFEHVTTTLESWISPDGRRSYGSGTVFILNTGNGMLEIIEAMRDGKHGGWRAHLYINGDCMAAFSRDDDEYAPDSYITHAQRTGLTLPEAVIRAAVSALKENSVVSALKENSDA